MSKKSFSTVRSLLWPVHNAELPKLWPMFLSFFLISFIYHVLRPFKISSVVMQQGSGAEIVPFLKLWGVLPAVFLFTYIFIKLCNSYSREKVFYIIVGSFIVFFALFTFVLYPNIEFLAPSFITNYLFKTLPSGAKGFILMLHYWPISVFYTLSELWGTIVLYTMFWGFANEVTSVENAKRFYSLFSLSSNISIIIAGGIGILIANWHYHPQLYWLGSSTWDQSLRLLMLIIIIVGIAILVLFKYIHLQNKNYSSEQATSLIAKLTQKKLSVTDSLKYTFQSSYLLYIAIIVIAYNIITNLSENLWTSQLELASSNRNEFTAYICYTILYLGFTATFIDLFITGNVIRKLGWTTAALITPIIYIITGSLFFYFLLSDFYHLHYNDLIYGYFAMPSTKLILIIGTIQLIASRACKATVMDASKELAYIPLEVEQKRKGKAVIDSLSARFAKGSGSIIHQALILSLGSMQATIPYIITIIAMLICLWLYAIYQLHKKMEITAIDKEKIFN